MIRSPKMSSGSDLSDDDNSNPEVNGEYNEDEDDDPVTIEGSDSEVDLLNNDVEIDVDESEYKDECRVDESHFDFIKRLGTGAYGTVFLVKKNRGIDKNKIYAIKVIAKEETVKNAKTIIHMKAERKVLEIIRGCPYIPKLYYAFQTDQKLFLVIDYIPGGEMFTLLQKCTLGEDNVRFYIAELIVALEHIHKHCIVYRDIKLENILIDADGHIKLVDFGLCKKLGPRGRAKSLCGTVEYMAPEIVSNEGHNYAADWWAVGVLTIELLTTTTPFGSNHESADGNEIMNRIANDNPIMPSNISPEMEDFILKMLIKDPEQRLGGSDLLATEIKQHPVFKGIDWDKLERKEIPALYTPSIEHPYDTQNFSADFTDLDATYEPSAVPHNTFLLFKGYSYIAPGLDEKQSNSVAYPIDVEGISMSWDVYSNREPDSEFDQKYQFASTQPIGIGRSSVCMKCINLNNNNCYAVKVYKRQVECSNQIDVLQKAAAKKLPGILHLVEVFRDSKWTYLIMELIDGDNLLEFLSKNSMTGRHVYRTFDALCKIIKNVHSLKYAHRRICFKNIYHIEHSQEWRIIGFSNAKPISTKHDEYIDYWSMGVCLYTLFCGHAPFVQGYDLETINKIEKSDFNEDSFQWQKLKKKTKMFIDQLLCSSTPTWNTRDLQECCMNSEFDSVNYSKQELDDNESIVSIRATKVQTQPVVETNLRTAFNGIDINGKNSIESPETISDVPQKNHSNVPESQTNHVNGRARGRGRPKKRKATPTIKTEVTHEDDKPTMAVISTSESLVEMNSDSLVEMNSDSLVEMNSDSLVLINPVAQTSNRNLRIRKPNPFCKQDIQENIHQPTNSPQTPPTEQIINIKVETTSTTQNVENTKPKKYTKRQTTQAANQQTTETTSTLAAQTISEEGTAKRSRRIAARQKEHSEREANIAEEILPAKRIKKEVKTKTQPTPRLISAPSEAPNAARISARSSARSSGTNSSEIGTQTPYVPLVYQERISKSSHGHGYCFIRFDYTC